MEKKNKRKGLKVAKEDQKADRQENVAKFYVTIGGVGWVKG